QIEAKTAAVPSPITRVSHHETASQAGRRSAALDPATARFAIDLPTALALAGADSPTIALAREAVRTRRAELTSARAQLLPSAHAGADFNLHRGNLQSSRGQIIDVDRQSAYVGAGAAAVGAGTVGVPGVRLVGHLADALFEPLAARQRIAEASRDAQGINN